MKEGDLLAVKLVVMVRMVMIRMMMVMVMVKKEEISVGRPSLFSPDALT